MDELRQNEIKEFIAYLSRGFTSDQAITQKQLLQNHQGVHGGSWHYTVVAKLPAEMSAAITDFSKQLYRVDSTLVQYDPELYHLTLCWFGAQYNVVELVAQIRDHLTAPIRFTLKDVMIAPYGIGIKAWPSRSDFIRIREAIYSATNRVVPDITGEMNGSIETFLTSWVSIARFGPKPQDSSQKFITEHMDEQFGDFTPDEFLVYKVDNKYLQNAELIAKIQNNGEPK